MGRRTPPIPVHSPGAGHTWSCPSRKAAKRLRACQWSQLGKSAHDELPPWGSSGKAEGALGSFSRAPHAGGRTQLASRKSGSCGCVALNRHFSLENGTRRPRLGLWPAALPTSCAQQMETTGGRRPREQGVWVKEASQSEAPTVGQGPEVHTTVAGGPGFWW